MPFLLDLLLELPKGGHILILELLLPPLLALIPHMLHVPLFVELLIFVRETGLHARTSALRPDASRVASVELKVAAIWEVATFAVGFIAGSAGLRGWRMGG